MPARALLSRPSSSDLPATLARVLLPAAWVGALVTAVGSVVVLPATGMLGVDAHAYWLAGRSAHPYGRAPGSMDAFLYSPAFAQLVRLPSGLPWPAFAVLWGGVEAAALGWLTAPLAWRWRLPALLACTPELLIGNIYGLLALAAVLGLRRPAWWAFPLLTKITPGLLGLLWFGARGEWRAVLRVLVATVAVAAGSYALDPDLWREWLTFLLHADDAGNGWVLLRAGIAAAVVVVGARTGRAWCLPLAMCTGAPVLSWSSKDLAVFAAVPRLARLRARRPGRAGPTG